MQKLADTYTKLKQILGGDTEPWESVRLVETYRRYWKPDKIKVILLAESHVFTNDGDRAIPMQQIPHLLASPDRYARFVYCLGYGERSLTNSHLHPRRDGTPQFWKIFYSCNNVVSGSEDFAPVLGTTPPDQRIRNKIDLLKELKAKGVWLVDASVVALYRNGMKVPQMFPALQTSWQCYTRDIVLSSNPEHVICVGKGVASVVESDLRRHFPERYTVLNQPNAFLSSEQHMANYQTYSRICHQRCTHLHPD